MSVDRLADHSSSHWKDLREVVNFPSLLLQLRRMQTLILSDSLSPPGDEVQVCNLVSTLQQLVQIKPFPSSPKGSTDALRLHLQLPQASNDVRRLVNWRILRIYHRHALLFQLVTSCCLIRSQVCSPYKYKYEQSGSKTLPIIISQEMWG